MEGAAGGIDAPLEVAEGFGGAGAGLTEREFVVGAEGVFVDELPELGFGGAEAAEGPLAGDEFIDEEAGFGGGGVERIGWRKWWECKPGDVPLGVVCQYVLLGGEYESEWFGGDCGADLGSGWMLCDAVGCFLGAGCDDYGDAADWSSGIDG